MRTHNPPTGLSLSQICRPRPLTAPAGTVSTAGSRITRPIDIDSRLLAKGGGEDVQAPNGSGRACSLESRAVDSVRFKGASRHGRDVAGMA
jgi:hypothetical protein